MVSFCTFPADTVAQMPKQRLRWQPRPREAKVRSTPDPKASRRVARSEQRMIRDHIHLAEVLDHYRHGELALEELGGLDVFTGHSSC